MKKRIFYVEWIQKLKLNFQNIHNKNKDAFEDEKISPKIIENNEEQC